MTRRALCGLVIVAGAWAAAGTAAQTPPPAQTPPQQPTFRTRIDSVSVDVSVSDKQGRPVVNLQASDFEVKENKQVQKIESFKLVQVDTLADTGPVRDILSASDQERELARDGTRLIVIFLDDYHTRKINALRIREQLMRFVSELGNNDLVAVMTPLMPATAVTFSYNHSATAQIVGAFDGRKYDYSPRNGLEAQYQRLPPEQIEQMRNSMVIGSLESLCSYLGAIRAGRKMLLYVSEGLNSTTPVALNMGQTVSGSMTGMNQMQLASDLQNSLNRVYQAASRANTSISTLDPRGLATPDMMTSSPQAAEVERQILTEGTDQLRVLANQTDGRAMVGSNDAMPGLRLMMRELSAYHLLGYTASGAHDGKFHEIQVRVLRKDVEVHARKGYWAYTDEEVKKANAPAKPGPPREVTEALSSLVSEADLAGRRVVRTWMGAVRGAADKATVTLVWETTSATPPAEPADRVDHVTVTATSIYGDALYSGKVAPDSQAGRPTGTVTFDAPAGGLRVRVVAENAKGLRLDAQDESFDVPNFAPGKPVVTAPAVFRARTVRDLQLLKAATAPMPAVTREFSRTERLLMRFQVFGPAGATAAVTMQLLNQQGTVMAALPSPTATASGYEAELALGPLPPGTYIIQIDADFGGEKAKTLMAIKVTG